VIGNNGSGPGKACACRAPSAFEGLLILQIAADERLIEQANLGKKRRDPIQIVRPIGS
jgi:hypothetical protein